MAIQGVGSSPGAMQQSLALQGEASQQAEAAEPSEAGGGDASRQVQVLSDAMEQEEQQAMQLIESSMGVGQNVDVMA